jgi:hypothetical protein
VFFVEFEPSSDELVLHITPRAEDLQQVIIVQALLAGHQAVGRLQNLAKRRRHKNLPKQVSGFRPATRAERIQA